MLYVYFQCVDSCITLFSVVCKYRLNTVNRMDSVHLTSTEGAGSVHATQYSKQCFSEV